MGNTPLAPFVFTICLAQCLFYSLSNPSESRNERYTNTFKCSEMEKACFRNNRILDPSSSKCYEAGDSRPCRDGDSFVASKESFRNEKRITGKCVSFCSPSGSFPDEDCITGHSAVDCPEEAIYGTDLFGESFCCAPEKCYTTVNQPDFENCCAVPNIEYLHQYHDPPAPWWGSELNCTLQDVECFGSNMLHSSSDGCVQPLQPCGSGGLWLADRGTWERKSRLQASCVPSLCPPGDIFLADIKRCASAWEVEYILCADDVVLFDIFGEAYCERSKHEDRLLNVSWIETTQNGLCWVTNPPSFEAGQSNAKPICAESDMKICATEAMSKDTKPIESLK